MALANAMMSAGRRIDGKTVEKYLQGLLDAFLIDQAERFDLRGKEVLKLNPKYYAADAVLRFLLVGRKGRDTGHVLENLVYLELLRRGGQVYAGEWGCGEVDFVVRDGQGLAYYQVAESTQQPEVLERELKPLRLIKDQYPGMLLTLDEINAEADYDGIRKRNALRWMLGKD